MLYSLNSTNLINLFYYQFFFSLYWANFKEACYWYLNERMVDCDILWMVEEIITMFRKHNHYLCLENIIAITCISYPGIWTLTTKVAAASTNKPFYRTKYFTLKEGMEGMDGLWRFVYGCLEGMDIVIILKLSPYVWLN